MTAFLCIPDLHYDFSDKPFFIYDLDGNSINENKTPVN